MEISTRWLQYREYPSSDRERDNEKRGKGSEESIMAIGIQLSFFRTVDGCDLQGWTISTAKVAVIDVDEVFVIENSQNGGNNVVFNMEPSKEKVDTSWF